MRTKARVITNNITTKKRTNNNSLNTKQQCSPLYWWQTWCDHHHDDNCHWQTIQKKTSRSRRISWWGKWSRQWWSQTTSQLGRRPSWWITYFERSLKKFEANWTLERSFKLEETWSKLNNTTKNKWKWH